MKGWAGFFLVCMCVWMNLIEIKKHDIFPFKMPIQFKWKTLMYQFEQKKNMILHFFFSWYYLFTDDGS